VAVLGADGLRAADPAKAAADPRGLGRVLFEREWLPGDSRAHGGDGLGPVYNDSSCIACHNLGGNGGGGPASKNVDILTASPSGQNIITTVSVSFSTPSGEPGFLGKALGSLFGLDMPKDPPAKPSSAAPADGKPAPRRKLDTGPLVKAHPGFRTTRSVVLHRFGTESGYEGWRQSIMGLNQFVSPVGPGGMTGMMQLQSAVNMGRQPFVQNTVGSFELVRSQRNPTALFGAGLIDSIPERVIEEAAKAKHPGFPEIAGRVSQLKDKRIGRFGWKAQTASLEDFVLTACAVELGLEVPGHHQGGSPQNPAAQAKGLDLSAQECNALVDYVRSLAKPAERVPSSDAESREVAEGRKLFASIGCATCHAPRLGDVEGLYSDLLLHDMGPGLGDTGEYGVFDPSSSEEEITDEEGPIAGEMPAPQVIGAPVLPPLPTLHSSVTVGVPVEPVPPPVVAEAPPIGIGPSVPQGTTALTPQPPPAADSVVLTAPATIRTGATVVSAPPTPTVVKRPTSGPASRFEWRTAPLWGFRDSGPYLHDGRADTLDQAIALHGGEAANIAGKYFGLSLRQRRQVEAFLKSLTAPEAGANERVASAR
jgi:mono/diheme cytochrome c family protein